VPGFVSRLLIGKGDKVKPDDTHNLKVLFPEIAGEWHPTKNGDLTPDKVNPAGRVKAWWRCAKGHEWQAWVFNRTRGNNCPYCCGNRATKENNLLIVSPETAKLWHPTKNGSLGPDQVTPHSKKKVWWMCNKGHEWKAFVGNMHRSKTGCPYCSGRRPSKEYNLLTLYPHLARQWHPFRNGVLTPDQVTPGSDKRVWWRCSKGHEWQAIVGNRTRKNYDCPYCANYFVSKENNLLVRYPELAKQWHPTKNGRLTPDKVMPGTTRKVWWRCRYGHSWAATVASRSSHGTGCPHCHRSTATKDNNFAVIHPEIARQWHPYKNEDLTPEEFSPRAPLSVWWLCPQGHEWIATIAERSSGGGCPYCTGK
jgi:hypothetical protein